MYINRNTAAAAEITSQRDPQQRCARILAVGDVAAWREAGHSGQPSGDIVFASFHEITASLLAENDPVLVVSPLIARHFDCVDLAELLGRLGFRGRYRAIGTSLPNPRMIEAEIRSLVPGLDFSVAPTWAEKGAA